MLDAAHPRGAALDSHPKTSVRDAAVAAQVEVPLKSFFGKLVQCNLLLQKLERRSAFAAAVEDAAAGTALANQAGLVGYEIQGLARHALALTRLGQTAQARTLAERSLELLGRQRYVEGSEEDVLGEWTVRPEVLGVGDRVVFRHVTGYAVAWNVGFGGVSPADVVIAG